MFLKSLFEEVRRTNKTLFYAPTLLLDLIQSHLPRRLFIALYKPSTELEREYEDNIRNKTRLAVYYAKRTIYERLE